MAILIIQAPSSLASLHMAVLMSAACSSWETSSCMSCLGCTETLAPSWAEPCQQVVVWVWLLVDHTYFIVGNCRTTPDSSFKIKGILHWECEWKFSLDFSVKNKSPRTLLRTSLCLQILNISFMKHQKSWN